MENNVEAPALKYNCVSPEEYLNEERAALEKHEYYQEKVFEMGGASIQHNLMYTNIFGAFGKQINTTTFKLFGSSLRYHGPINNWYFYPSLSIICDTPLLTDKHLDTATNPSVIIEIVSRSTRGYDQLKKLELYKEIHSLKEFVLVNVQRVHLQHYLCDINNNWQQTNYKSLRDSIRIETVNVTLPLNEIYAGVL